MKSGFIKGDLAPPFTKGGKGGLAPHSKSAA
jgi:hypothetical protein